MSKSLGNFVYLHDLLKRFSGNTLRYFYFTTHYRQPLTFTPDKLIQAEQSMKKIERFIDVASLQGVSEPTAEEEQQWTAQLLAPLLDDLNTPAWMALLFETMRLYPTPAFRVWLKHFLEEVMGADFSLQEETLPASIQEWLEKRQQAKLKKDYAQADRIRGELLELGYEIQDTPEGTICIPTR